MYPRIPDSMTLESAKNLIWELQVLLYYEGGHGPGAHWDYDKAWTPDVLGGLSSLMIKYGLAPGNKEDR